MRRRRKLGERYTRASILHNIFQIFFFLAVAYTTRALGDRPNARNKFENNAGLVFCSRVLQLPPYW
jgi:hypothetical protein